ncbi:anti-sigma-factor antagonist [Candidatus Magnetoovum chiemensis]|nr:anti-sigma-factor antagonist [Candidatus Magnetoovum chiemensis]
MIRKEIDNDEFNLIILLLVHNIYDYEDRETVERVLSLLRRRFEDKIKPELFRLLREPGLEHPSFQYALYERIKKYLSRLQLWEPEIDELFRYSISRRHYQYSRNKEIESITRGLMSEFTYHIERNIEKGNKRLGEELSSQSEKVAENIRSILRQQETAIVNNRGELHNFLWLVSTDADFKKAKITRYVPARIYVSNPVPEKEILSKITEALNKFVDSIGLELSDDLPEENGSWWKRLFYKTKQHLSQDEVKEKIKLAEDALKLNYLDKPQAEANKAQAEAVSLLIQALSSTSNACLQLGSLLVIKTSNPSGKSAIIARTLTQKELKALEEKQSMLNEPERILEWLQECNKEML